MENKILNVQGDALYFASLLDAVGKWRIKIVFFQYIVENTALVIFQYNGKRNTAAIITKFGPILLIEDYENSSYPININEIEEFGWYDADTKKGVIIDASISAFPLNLETED